MHKDFDERGVTFFKGEPTTHLPASSTTVSPPTEGLWATPDRDTVGDQVKTVLKLENDEETGEPAQFTADAVRELQTNLHESNYRQNRFGRKIQMVNLLILITQWTRPVKERLQYLMTLATQRWLPRLAP